MMKNLYKNILIVIICILLSFGIFRIQKYFDNYQDIKFVNLNPVFLPDGEVLKWLSMGFRGVVADYLWIRSVLYYGRRVIDWDNPYYRYAVKNKQETLPSTDSAVSQIPDTLSYNFESDSLRKMTKELRRAVVRRRQRSKHVEYIYPLLDRVTTVDPYFEFPYIFGGVYLLLDTQEYNKAYNLLKKGFEVNENSWKFPFYLGWIEWMYKNNPTKAVELILQAVDNKDCPHYVESMLSWLMQYIKYEKIDHTMITKSYLQSLRMTTKNKKLRERINDYLKQIEANKTG